MAQPVSMSGAYFCLGFLCVAFVRQQVLLKRCLRISYSFKVEAVVQSGFV